MLYYLSSAEGTGGRLKAAAEDFIVDEISLHPPEFADGKFSIATVRARNWETNRMVRILARQLGISRDRIGFAGTKDKRAVTTQLMSFMCPPDRLTQVNLQDLEISDVYTARRGMTIGDLTLDLDFQHHLEIVESLGFELLVKRAKIGQAKHVRVRPMFREWQVVAKVAVIDKSVSGITEEVLQRILDAAGAQCGLCDWRPSSRTPGQFGRFTAEVEPA